MRPFGALVFGRVGDLVGRKYTFLVTIVVMGISTFAVGLLPTYQTIGWAAPILLVSLRLLQGLALGGEYGGAATYVAEHAPNNRRGYDTGVDPDHRHARLLPVAGRDSAVPHEHERCGLRRLGLAHPFLVSLILLVFSVYIRLKLQESPVFQKMKSEGKGSKAPLTDSFLKYPNNKYVLLALLGATAGQGVVWYTGQFYALFFLTITLKVDYVTAYILIGASLLLGTPFFIVFGWLSDRIGRLKIILAGCLIAALTYFPLFQGLTHYVNPALEAYSAKTPIIVSAPPRHCNFHMFVGPWSTFTDCDKAKDFLTKQGLSFKSADVAAGDALVGQDRRQGVEGSLGREGGHRCVEGHRLSRPGRQEQDQLRHDAADPVHHADLRDDGLRPDRRVPGGAVPHPHPLHLDVAAVSHRQWLVWRHAAVDWPPQWWRPRATSTTACGTRSSWRS